ncbi:MAG: hypothetical protein OHK0052_08000 [Anaerolineales bacterium]
MNRPEGFVQAASRDKISLRDAYPELTLLEFSEFVTQNAKDEIQVITYSYHWSDNNHRLIRRWDNTPRFPALENFPHHIHLTESQVIPGNPMNIFRVLDEIKKTITPS